MKRIFLAMFLFVATVSSSFGDTLSKIQESVVKYTKDSEIDDSLVYAIIETESQFNPKARSSEGAVGLMQILPRAHPKLSVAKLYTIDYNVKHGVRILEEYLKATGSMRKALKKYSGGDPRYVNKVLKRSYKYADI